MADLILYLDLDSTLIHSCFNDSDAIEEILNMQGTEKLKDRIYHCVLVDSSDSNIKGVGQLEEFYLILRPHVREFIEYISQNIGTIHIWSAGQFRYVRCIESILFPPNCTELINKPCNVLSNKHCEITENYVLKDLSIHTDDLSKCLIIDDREDTFSKNPKNAIHIPAYNPEPTKTSIMEDDDSLLKIINWFERSGVLTARDVRRIPKNIFK
jgi:TFIIF-interacting CTD phosphatase-like protein